MRAPDPVSPRRNPHRVLRAACVFSAGKATDGDRHSLRWKPGLVCSLPWLETRRLGSFAGP